MPNADIYIPDDVYSTLVAALMKAAHDRNDHRSALIQALGEVGGIWPEKVRDDAMTDA